MAEGTLTHGDNRFCPEVNAGVWKFCKGHAIPDPHLAARDTLWCKALIPEGAEVIQRVTERFLDLRRQQGG